MYLFELVLLFSSDIYPGVEFLDHMVVLFFFLKNLYTVFHSGGINLHFHQQCTGFPFSTPLPTFVICGLFDVSHSDG